MVQLKDNTGDRNTSYSNTFPFLNGTIEKLPSAAQYVIYKRFQFLYGTIAGVGGGAVHDMGKGFNSSMVQLKDDDLLKRCSLNQFQFLYGTIKR